MKVLVACEFSGIVRDAFIAKGHKAMSCDLLDTERKGPHYTGDVLDILKDGWDLMIAHPPCTYLCISGNKWFLPEYKSKFPQRAEQRKDAIAFFMALALAPIERICIENPVGIMSSIYGRPDQIIQPFQFGHKEPKRTCLWLKGLPLLKPTNIVEPEYVVLSSGKKIPKWYSNAPVKGRNYYRSKTFQGIADAMADQWG